MGLRRIRDPGKKALPNIRKSNFDPGFFLPFFFLAILFVDEDKIEKKKWKIRKRKRKKKRTRRENLWIIFRVKSI